MEGSQPISGKSILFLLVEGFEHERFDALSCCLQEKGGNLLFAGFNKGDTITSKDEKLKVESDVSFAEASEEYHDVVAVADNVTAEAVREIPAAMKLIERSWGRGNVVVTIDKGALALIGAGIVDNKNIAAAPELAEDLKNAGADVSDTPIAISDNILSARADADINVLCDDIVNYLTKGKAAA